MSNYSTVRRQQENRKRNVTPSDVYRQDDVYFYRLGNPDSGDESYVTWTSILNLLANNSQIVSFSIERIKVLKGMWGDSVNTASIKGFKQRQSTTTTIPDFDQEELRIDEAFLQTKYPLEDYVQSDGRILESPDVQWWVTAGSVERTQNGAVIFSLETMNSFDWQTQDDVSGITINKQIELSLVNRRGESVKEFMVEFDSEALIGLPNGLKLLDDNNVAVDWDIDWDKTDPYQFDITHITPNVTNTDVKIESHALSCFKFFKWLESVATLSIGIPYATLRYSTELWVIPTGDAIGGNWTNLNKAHLDTEEPFENPDSVTKQQIETEFIENMEYSIYTDLKNTWIDDRVPFLFQKNRDLSDDVKNNTIRNILPDNEISEVSSKISISYNNGYDTVFNPKIPNTFDNPNIDTNSWWLGDWKENRNSGYKSNDPVTRDGIIQVIIGQVLKRKTYDIEYIKTTINNLLTGKSNVYKGFQINELPETLINITRPDKYSEFTLSDKDYYVLSTFDIKEHYDANKDYYESLAPTRTNTLVKYKDGSRDDKFNFLDPQSIKGLFLNFLYKQESGKKKRIYGKFNTAIKFPKTYDFHFIDGGKSFSIYQYADENLNPALDADGKEVGVIQKRTTWYKSKDKRFTRNSGTFSETAIKGIHTGYIETDIKPIEKGGE